MNFVTLCISFFIGVFIYFTILPQLNNTYIYFSFIIILYLFRNYIVRKKIYYYIISFFIGILIAYVSFFLNNTYIIKKQINFQKTYGTVYKIEKSNYNNKQYIYLKDVIFTSKKYNEKIAQKTFLKLTYNKQNQIHIGDIIQATTTVFPPSQPLIPFGFNFRKNNFFNKISANGYIVGNIKIIKQNNTFKHQSFIYNLLNKIHIIKNNIKDKIKKDIKKYSSENTAPFLIAILIGEYSFLPQQNLEDLRKSSLAHLISISGYHISVISAFIFFVVRTLITLIPLIALNYDTKRIAAITTIGFILFYIFIVGNHIPAIRASIMSVAFLIGIALRLQVFSFHSLFLAGVIILTFSPYAIFSASFLLSFFATLTLIYFFKLSIVKRMNKNSNKNIRTKIFFFIIISMLLTFCIEISLFPLMAYYFHMIPLNGVFANTIVAPIFSFIIMPSLILYFILPLFIGKYFIMIGSIGLQAVIKIASFFSNLPYSIIYTDLFSGALLTTMVVIFTAMLIINNRFSLLLLLIYFTLAIYYFMKPTPDLIIDYSGNNLAIKENKNYFFSSDTKEFVKNFWFKNPKFSNNDIINMKNVAYEKDHYVVSIKGKKISIAETTKYVTEDCKNVDIILITKRSSNIKCSDSLIIDQNFLNKKGSTEIYINNDKNIIFSANDSYFQFIKNILLQYYTLITKPVRRCNNMKTK